MPSRQQRNARRLVLLVATLAMPLVFAAVASAEAASAGSDSSAVSAGSAVKGTSADRVLAAFRESRARIDAGDLAEALGPAKRAYDYAQKDLGVDDEALAITAANLGKLLLDLGRPVDALRPLTHALELYDRQKGPASAAARKAQGRIARANLEMGRYETAERTYLDLIERAKQTEGDPTAELARIDARLMNVTLKADAPVRAMRYGKRGINRYQKALGPGSLPEGLITVRLARSALETGDWDEGLELLDHGVPILEEHLDASDQRIADMYVFLIDIYEKVGDTRRERRYRIRLKKSRAASQAAE